MVRILGVLSEFGQNNGMLRLLLIAIFGVTVSFSVRAQTIASAQSGPWNQTSTWTGGVIPTSSNSSLVSIGTTHAITIPSGYTATAKSVSLAGSTSSSIAIASGGVLDFSNVLTLGTGPATRGKVTVNGTLIVEEGATIAGGVATSGRLTIGSTGTYQHNYAISAGQIYTATWNAGSTLAITGYTTNATSPTGLNQSFSNFIWNCPNQQTDIYLDGSLATVTGNFSVLAPVASFIFGLTTDNTSTLTIGGSITLAQDVFLDMSGGAGNSTINVAGGFTMNSDDGIGNYGSASALINFNSAGTQNFVNQNLISSSIDIAVLSGTLNIAGNNFVSTVGNFSVSSGAGINVGSTSSTGAIQTGTSAGGIRAAGTRTFASGSTITYNGLSAQFLGNGNPSTTGVTTVINNASGVSLASNVTVGGDLILTSGNLSLLTRTLTLGGIFTPNANSMVATSSSGLIINGSGAFGTLSFSGGSSIGTLTINRTSSGNVTLGNDITITNSFNQTAGDLILNGHTFKISGTGVFTRTAGNLSVDNAATVIFTGSGALPSSVGFTGSTLNTLTLDKDVSTQTLNASSSITITNLNLTGGIFTNSGTTTMATGGTITRADDGSITNAPVAATSYNVIYNLSNPATSGPELLSSSTGVNNLSNIGSSTLTLNSAVTVNGILTLSNGVFNAGANAVTLKGNFVSNASSTFTGNTVTMGGTTVLSGSAPPIFKNLTVSGIFTPNTNYQVNGNIVDNGTFNAGTGNVTFGGTTTISGSAAASFNAVTINSGNTMTAPVLGGAGFKVAGDFTNNGTFNHNNGAITFNGTTSILGTNATSLFKTTITGTLTAPASTLSVAGDFANTGTFTSSGGTLVLNGTTGAQNVTGTYSLNNLNVSNPSGVNNNGNIALNGTFSLVGSGIFDADGAGSGVFTIKSTNVNAGGRIASLTTPGNFGGVVTIERFINGPDAWRYISFPLTSGNVGQWKTNFPITGSFSDASPAGVNGVVNAASTSIYTYNPTTAAYVAVGSGGTTASTALSNLKGYSVYTYLSSDFTLSLTGNIRTGAATIPVSTGYNLVSNPYPSAIDWDNITRTGFSSTMSIRVSNGVFASYVAGGASTNPPFVGWTGEVATGQSFWVQSTGATTLALTETAKTAGTYQFLRESAPSNMVRIALSSDKQRDETLIWFNDQATAGIDDSYDAIKMRNGYFEPDGKKGGYLNISTVVNDSLDFSINGVAPLASCNGVFKLNVADVSPGNFNLSFSDLATMNLGYRIILVDRFAAVEKEVSDGFQYSFDVTTDKASFGKSRFELRVLLPNSLYVNSVVPPTTSILDQCDSKNVPISLTTQSGANYQFYAGSKAISSVVSGTDSKITVNISKDSLQTGSNNISLKVSTGVCETFSFDNALAYTNLPLGPVTINKQGIKLSSSSQTGNQWYKDGAKIDGAVNNYYYATEAGDYSVDVSNGVCSLQSASVHIDIDSNLIYAYPVPTSDKVHLILPEKISKTMNGYTLYDSKGVKVFDQTSYPDLLLSDDKMLDLSNMESGMYLLLINSDTRYPIKLIKK